jgi:hypothetical protein
MRRKMMTATIRASQISVLRRNRFIRCQREPARSSTQVYPPRSK